MLTIDKLGLSGADDSKLARLLQLPHGMIVVTGPTGSGKTTTLATLLSILNESTRKILTIEDPVEYEIRGVSQSQVKPSIGLTFASALRAFVRQDPDVIMTSQVGATTEGSKAMRVTVRMAFDSGRTITSAAVILVDGHDEPYRVLSWQSDADVRPATQSAPRNIAEGRP